MLDKNFVKKYLLELFNYHKRELSDFVFQVWYQKLSLLSEQQFVSAIAIGIAESAFMPTAQQVLEFAQDKHRRPGENTAWDINPASLRLQSHEDRLTREEIAELNKRGRLVAKIILNCTGHMTSERKEQLIEQFKTTPTHELEMIAATSDLTRKSSSFNNIRQTLEKIEQDMQDSNHEEF
jgi:hypothetical protein